MARAVTVTCGAALGLGAAAGAVTRVVAASALPAERASAAVVIVLGLAIALAPAVPPRGRAGVLRATGAAALAAIAAPVVAGGDGFAPGAALVVAGVAALAAGAALVARRCGAAPGSAHVLGAALPALLVGAVFIADPFIEWRGPASNGAETSLWVYRANPVAAATSQSGGTGLDWQTRPLMYDGHGAGGLSVIGQYYPVRPPSAWAWGALALALGTGLALAGGPPRAPGSR